MHLLLHLCQWIYIIIIVIVIYPHLRTCSLSSERGKGREKERNINRLPLARTPFKDQTRNPGMFPDQASNRQTFGLQDNAPTNWATPAMALQYRYLPEYL